MLKKKSTGESKDQGSNGESEGERASDSYGWQESFLLTPPASGAVVSGKW